MDAEVAGMVKQAQRRIDGAMARRREEIKSGAATCAKESKGGAIRKKYEFPPECFYRAKLAGADVRDPEYLEWEATKNPEFRAFHEDKPVFSLQHLTPLENPVKPRTRFGKSTYRSKWNAVKQCLERFQFVNGEWRLA